MSHGNLEKGTEALKARPDETCLNLLSVLWNLLFFLCALTLMSLLPKHSFHPSLPANPLLLRNKAKTLCITSLTNRQRLLTGF